MMFFLGPIEILIILLVVIGVIKLIKHGHGLKLVIGIVSVIAVGVVATFLAYDAPKVVHKTIDGVEQVTDNLSDTLGDLEKELDKFTKPQIELGEEPETPATEEEKPAEESATELKSEPKLGEPLPAWVTDPPNSEEGVWQTVVATEPCFSLESLAHAQKELIQKTLATYWGQQLGSLPENFSRWLEQRSERPGAVLDQYTEHRETSVGEAFVAHLLLNIGEPEKKWFTQQWKAWKAEERLSNRGMRVTGIGLLSGAVLSGLAVLYGLLRMSEK